MGRGGDGGGGPTETGLACASCGVLLSPTAKFCSECGTAISKTAEHAEYKQVTVLFADVVHSMDIAWAVGAERLREIMADLLDRSAAAVKRYGGTLSQFTGDGIMAVFGAPITLEDHAVRACLAALDIQDEAKRLADDVQGRDGIDLRLRAGLNSGQVIAGEIGSESLGYTAMGEQVGMAQRMESVAPPGGVILSASTARLVDSSAALGEAEFVQIKGTDEPVRVHRLLSVGERRHDVGRDESTLVGRRRELSAVEGLLDRAVGGHHGAVIGVVGPPGIGKSRLVREAAALARRRNGEVFTTFSESHASRIPFHAVARLLRAVTGVEGLDGQTARDAVRNRVPHADPEDLLLFDDLLGIADPADALPQIDPDARRRRLTALVSAALTARETPALYVIEDAHWIDEISESMLAEFVEVISGTRSLVLVTYRPEYRGPLSQVPGGQTISLAPLSVSEISALVDELLGPDPSLGGMAGTLAERAAGNPFFAEEMVRDLAERGVLSGDRGNYRCAMDVADLRVPATLQATLAARIDRLDSHAKRTLNAAAVIGSQFDADLLVRVVDSPEVSPLIEAELLDEVIVASRAEYAFRHPLIRAVAYESQLKSRRAELHHRLATVMEQQDSTDENAALIAEHREAAGNLPAAYAWRMRAGSWLMGRDVAAARRNWERACRLADALPSDFPDHVALRCYPRTMLCQTAWRVGSSVDETLFDELRTLCTTSGTVASLAAGLSGTELSLTMGNRHREAARLASEQIALFDSADDPMSMFVVMSAAMFAKLHAGEVSEALRVAQAVTDLLADDGSKGNIAEWGMGSPLAVALLYRAQARACLGDSSWHADFERAIAIQRELVDATVVIVITYGYSLSVTNGFLLPGAAAVAQTADVLRNAEKSSDDVALALAQAAQGIVVTRAATADHGAGVELMAKGREAQLLQRNLLGVSMADISIALLKADTGDVDGAIAIARATVNELADSGEMVIRGAATAALVTALLMRGNDTDVHEAEAAVNRLAAVPTEPGLVVNDVWLLRLRALLARSHGDDSGYRDYRNRYRAKATSLGFEGHMKWAQAMP